MESLRIPITHVPARGLSVRVTAPLPALQPAGVPVLTATETTLEGTLTRAGEEYFFEGWVNAEFSQACDRCLNATLAVVRSPVFWLFAEAMPERAGRREMEDDEMGLEADDPDLPRRIEGNVIDLVSPLWEELVLVAPEKILCRENCMGLCSRCGADLNSGPCGCAREEEPDSGKNKGLAKLAELFPDLQKPTEE